MIRAAALAMLLLTVVASSVNAKSRRDCYDLGHVGTCSLSSLYRATEVPRRSLLAEVLRGPKMSDDLYRKVMRSSCTGWRDDSGICRHGLSGSGMGPRGMIGRCGAGTC